MGWVSEDTKNFGGIFALVVQLEEHFGGVGT
jgi:hypothetical protein